MFISLRFLSTLVLLAIFGATPARAAIVVFDGNLVADQVVPSGGSTSTATGFASVFVDTSLFTITTDLSFEGLTGPADRAHLHNAPEGQRTDFTFEHEVLGFEDPSATRTIPCPWSADYANCAPATATIHDVLQLSADNGYGFADFNSLLNAFEQDGIYIDVHTQMFPAGEIRGQLSLSVPEPSTLALLCLSLLVAAAMRRHRQSA
jgi:hypothetical protein